MEWIDIILSFITTQICFVSIIFMSFRKQKSGLIKTFIVLDSCYFCWTFCTLVLSSFNLETKAYLFTGIKYISAFSIGPIWFVFYLYFSRSVWLKEKLNFKKIFLVFSPVLVFLLLFLFNVLDMDIHFFDSYGKIISSKGLWLCLIVQSVYHFAGLIIVIRSAFTPQTIKLSILITAGFTLAQSITVLYYSSSLYVLFDFMDIFPLSALITLITFGIASYRYQFLNILPLALPEIVNGLKEGIMIVDGKGQIVSANKILEEILGMDKKQLLGKNSSDISDYILKNWKYSDESKKAILAIGISKGEELKGIIELNDKAQYEIQCQPLKNANFLIGWVVSFYNIHEHKSLMDELSEKNIKISEAYTKLLEHAKVVEELSASRERNRLASEIHDSLGHCLAILVSMLEVMKISYSKQPEVVGEKLNSAHAIAKNGLTELRHMVSNFSTKKENYILESLQSMIKGFEATGIKVELTLQGECPVKLDEKRWAAIYNTCKEALTNALKHGEAQNVMIILRFDEKIDLYILDNGKGCPKLTKNMGLQGMEDRIRELNGSISFGAGEESGFSIHIEIPAM